MYTLLEKFFKDKNGRKIYYKVMGTEPNVGNKPFLLFIEGGPGFGHEVAEPYFLSLEKRVYPQSIPNIIQFDALGCGKSDSAKDIAAEYTMKNFAEIAAAVVENVKKELCPDTQMDLRVFGGSFGSFTAMDLPLHRKEWLDEKSPIHLRHIITEVGPNGVGDWEYTNNFAEANFKDNPNYPRIKSALKKLETGTIQDTKDYIANFVLATAPLYSEEFGKIALGPIGKAIQHAHFIVIPLLRAVRFLSFVDPADYIHHEFIAKIDKMIKVLSGMSLEVLNHFFGISLKKHNVVKNVQDNLDIYSRVALTITVGEKDHMVDYRNSVKINELLPDTSAVVVHKDKHMSSGESKEVALVIRSAILCNTKIPEYALNSKVILRQTITPDYQLRLAQLNYPMTTNLTSTSVAFKALEHKESPEQTPRVVVVEEQAKERRVNPELLELDAVNPGISRRYGYSGYDS